MMNEKNEKRRERGALVWRAISDIDERYLLGVERPTARRRKSVGHLRKTLVLCAALIVCASVFALLPLFRVDDIPDSSEYADFRMDGSTLVEYVGEGENTLVIPDGVKVIADYAFKNNESAKNIKVVLLSASVETVAENGLAGLDSLEDVIAAAGSEFFKTEGGATFSADGEYLLHYSGEGESYTLPSGVRYISAHAFQSSSLTSVELNDGLLYIGYNAFAGLELAEIYLPDSVEEIAEGAFSGCMKAIEGHIGENTAIGENSFWCVPFYNTLCAGKPCPAEDVLRENVTITEAFLSSDRSYIMEQISDIIDYYNGVLGDKTSVAFGAIYESPSAPQGVILPNASNIDIEGVSLFENTWSSQASIEVRIPCEGGYCISIGFAMLGAWEELCWENVTWRAEDIRFISDDSALTADESYGEWLIEYAENEITFTRGGYSFTEDRFPYSECRLALSDNGDMFIVELLSGGIWSFIIEDFSGTEHTTWWSYSGPCVPYYSKADGDYIPHSARFVSDADSEWQVICESVYGSMRINIYAGDYFIRDAKECGEAYMYYDVEYFEGETTRGDVLSDGTYELAEATLAVDAVCGFAEHQKLYDYASQMSVTLDLPATWTPYCDSVRESHGLASARIEFYGQIYDFAGELGEENIREYLSAPPEKYRAFGRGETACGYEYCYFVETRVTGADTVTDYVVSYVRSGDYVVPILFMSYRDGDAEDYIENVILKIIESIDVKKYE